MLVMPRSREPTRSTRLAAAAFVLLILLASASAADRGSDATWVDKVVGVADGDTITVLRGRQSIKIRLHGVDCPEKKQPFGQLAKQFTSKLVFGKLVTVRPVTVGKYGRTIADVLIDGKSLNEALVQAGLAWWYRKHAPKEKVLAALEVEARKAKRGLWAVPNPTPPWAYRHRGKPLRGNQRTKVFHAAGCSDYLCANCRVKFKTIAEARRARFRAHRTCVEQTR